MSKPVAVVVVLAAAGLAALATPSCFVHRVTDDFACGSSSECGSGRVCEQGYCVDGATTVICPSPCQSCDLDAKTCRIDCTSGRPCGNVHCPAGYDCTIRCTNSGACGDVDCAQAHGCDVDCSGSSACGNLNCGTGACAVRCSGALACPSVDCAASCKCDVTCNNTALSCPVMSCPMALGPCTQQGSSGAPCSSDPPGCDVCF